MFIYGFVELAGNKTRMEENMRIIERMVGERVPINS